MITYKELKEYIIETYDYLTPNVAWGYNEGYLDAITDHTDDFRYQEITALIILNSEIKKEKLDVLQ